MLRIGTRGSALALAQANWVADGLRAAGTDCELVTITTAGDRGQDVGDKERWVSELERALLDGAIELAVHSAKDVPAELAPGTELAAFPVREDPRDVLCGARSLGELPAGARVGTSSLRRTAQLRALRSDLEIVELRGNVDTRLRKLADGQADAIVLAAAGLERLGRRAEAGGTLDEFVPAPGQGALALQVRADERPVAGLDDPAVSACVRTERVVVQTLGASCHTPVGAHAGLIDDGSVELTVWVGLPDGSEWLSDRLTGAPEAVGLEVAERMLAAGAGELLRRAEAQAAATT